MASSARIAKVDRRAVSGPTPGSLHRDLHPHRTPEIKALVSDTVNV